MLACPVNPKSINIQCGKCTNCQGVSKLDYPFAEDLRRSNELVSEIMAFITRTTGFRCEETKTHKNPDINVLDSNDRLVCRIEAKYLGPEPFKMSRKFVNLMPKETLVVDHPKLLSYFACKQNDRAFGKDIPIFVVWKFDRICPDVGGITVFQEIDVLEEIYNSFGSHRFRERKAAYNDYQDGTKLGITGKYHYSIRECEPIENLPHWILSL